MDHSQLRNLLSKEELQPPQCDLREWEAIDLPNQWPGHIINDSGWPIVSATLNTRLAWLNEDSFCRFLLTQIRLDDIGTTPTSDFLLKRILNTSAVRTVELDWDVCQCWTILGEILPRTTASLDQWVHTIEIFSNTVDNNVSLFVTSLTSCFKWL